MTDKSLQSLKAYLGHGFHNVVAAGEFLEWRDRQDGLDRVSGYNPEGDYTWLRVTRPNPDPKLEMNWLLATPGNMLRPTA